MNRIRIRYIQDILISEKIIHDHQLTSLEIIDVGCGGGILSAPLHRLGASVTGLDPSHDNISIAQNHAANAGYNINYVNTSLEQFDHDNSYNIACALEIVEHVADLPLFLKSLSRVTKVNGYIFISTINKTMKSYLQAIFIAEYILRMTPIGTHAWDKFVKPHVIAEEMQQHHCQLIDIKGMKYNIFDNAWTIDRNTDVNYIMAFRKLQ